MSRIVNMSQPLSSEDRAYLFQMNRHAAIADNDERFSSDEEEGQEEEVSDEAGDSAVLTEEEVEPYEQWTVAELSAECNDRDLPKNGTKAELVTRLYADDASDQNIGGNGGN